MLALRKAEKRGETPRRAVGEEANSARGEAVQLANTCQTGQKMSEAHSAQLWPPSGEGKGARGRAITALRRSLCGFSR